jgi:rod shape-determining protein MreD
MRSFQEANVFLIVHSFLVAIALTILPLPHWEVWLRPQWVLAVLLFWVLISSEQSAIAMAWLAGILMDLVTGTPLGLQAFVFVSVAYGVLRLRSIIEHLPIWQQASAIGVFVFMNGLLQGIGLSWMGHSMHIGLHILSAITTALIWPWIFAALDQLRPRALIR